MATTEERFSALQWAAGLRGAVDESEALEWMVARDLVDYDEETQEAVLTPLGIERGEQLAEALQETPSGEPFQVQKRFVWGVLVAFWLLWRGRARRHRKTL